MVGTFKKNWFVLSLLAVMLTAGGAWAQTTRTVDDDGGADFTSIQAAINAAIDGDIIEIAAGTYPEAVLVNKAVTLNGPNVGISPNTGTRVTEAVINPASGHGITIDNTNGFVIVDGLTIDNIAGAGFFIVERVGLAADVTIKNVIITNIDGLAAINCAYQGSPPYADHANMTIRDNLIDTVTGTNQSGMYLQEVTGNLIVEDNVVNNINYGGILLVDGFTGTVALNDNTITNTGQQGIQLAFVVNDATVSGNVITNANTINGSDKGGIRLYGSAFTGTVNIFGNTIISSFNGIAVKDLQDITGKNINIYDNDLANNSNMGLYHGGTGALNALTNWWGDASGPYNASSNPAGSGAGVSDNVQFDPWWADAGMTTTGSNAPVHNVTQDTYHATIQAAIDAANSGDTINVAAGTYDENLVFNKSLNLQGPNAAFSPNTDTRVAEAILMPSSGLAISGNANGIDVYFAGLTVDMNLTAQGDRYMDQTGKTGTSWVFEHNIFQNAYFTSSGHWRFSGDNLGLEFSLLDNFFTGSEVSNGIAVWGTNPVILDIRDNVWEDNGYTAMNINHGQGVISGNIFRDTRTMDLDDPGFYFGDYQSGLLLAQVGYDLDITNNTFENVCYGVSMYANVDGPINITDNIFNGVAISGVRASSSQPLAGSDLDDVTVTNNQMLNYFGTGFMVSNGRPDGSVLTAENNWWGTADGAAIALLAENFVDYDPWLGQGLGQGSIAATPAVGGPVACGGSETFVFSLTTDAYTADVFGYNAVVQLSPELTLAGTINSSISSLAPFGGTTVFQVSDQGGGSYMISGTTTGFPTQPISGAGTTPLFSINVEALNEGTGTITFNTLNLRDPNNAPLSVVGTGGTLTIDCTGPAAVTGITAVPGHNKVDVSWTHDGTDVDHYVIFSGLWYDDNLGVGNSAYPEYDDLAESTVPTAPSNKGVAYDSSEWVALPDSTGSTNATQSWSNSGRRGVYYYTVFAVDAVGNTSPAPAALDRSTNYWLGDVAINGLVNNMDITALGTAFGTSESGGGAYNNAVDVGPTDDWSRLGIPTTDSAINFEDLIIFSLNYGVVSAAKEKPAISNSVDLEWIIADNGDMALRLVEGSGLKGLNVRADVPVQLVEAGQLLDEQSELTFLKNIGQNLDVSVAVMGINNAFSGTGDLFIVRGAEGLNPADLHITARSIENKNLEVKLTQGTGSLTPRVFNLNANYPNPFNPMTKISFSLPEAQNVRLNVYSLDGRKVATLLNETRGAGLHEVVWTGRNDDGQSVASGLYFYRIDAGPYSQVRKMTLMK